MGLLTDPGTGKGKLAQQLVKHHAKLCTVLYIAGVCWFLLLAYQPYNAGTYFSENALLPGLVRVEFDEEVSTKRYLSDLQDEATRYLDSIPYAWLLAQLKQLGLDTYTHNFTLHYPLGMESTFTGKNVYAILRAPRSASTESLVLSVPYRPPTSVHPTTAPSIALALGLAKYFRKQNYWAKDIIFLITEHEQLGIQAWLAAYHQVPCGEGVLKYGDLEGRAGAIQAAVNLELHAERISHVDVKVEGLNGQLPNLDLVNLVHRLCTKEGIAHYFKNRDDPIHPTSLKGWLHSLQTLLTMVATQATGVPNGNHGLFHRYAIEAVTIEGVEAKNTRHSKAGLYQVGRMMEGMFRSLNNLLERFHQSFFFYLLPSTDRYVSIGLYMPPFGLIIASLLIKALALWLSVHQEKATKETETNEETKEEAKENEEKKETKEETKENEEKRKTKENEEKRKTKEAAKENEEKRKTKEAAKENGEEKEAKAEEKENEGDEKPSSQMLSVLSVFLVTHTMGLVLVSLSHVFSKTGLHLGFATDASVYIGYLATSVALLGFPVIVKRNVHQNQMTWQLLKCGALLDLSTLLASVAMYNFSLALITAVLYTPVVLVISPSRNRFVKFLKSSLWLLLHPLSLLFFFVSSFAIVNYADEPWKVILEKTINANRGALLYSVVDSYIYGNWVFSVACVTLYPVWLVVWVIPFWHVE